MHSWPVLVALYWAAGVTAGFIAHRALRHSGAALVYAVLVGVVWPWALAACVVGGLIALAEGRKHGPH